MVDCRITQGRERVCKDSQGGIDKIYLFKHVNYIRSLVTLVDNLLVYYPETIIYEFEPNNQPNIQQSQNENEGGKYFDISFDIELAKVTGQDYKKFLDFDFNAIVKDRNGKYRFLGNWNGLTCTNLNYTTGGGKSELNGVRLSFEGQELEEAWFIEDLSGAGFIINGFLLQENTFYLLQEDGSKIYW